MAAGVLSPSLRTMGGSATRSFAMPLRAHPHAVVANAKCGKPGMRRAAAQAAAPGEASKSTGGSTKAKLPYVGVLSADFEGCEMAIAMYDNTVFPDSTKITVQVGDFPSLLRTISWVMNGMSVRVKGADARTDENGIAHDTFYITDLKGRKLSDDAAAGLVDRIEDFVVYCSPYEQKKAQEWTLGPVRVSNLHHDKFTEVLVFGEPDHAGFLLELTSVLSGIGAIVHEATLRSDASMGGIPDHIKYDFSAGRLFRFMVSDRSGRKLNASRVASLLYTYDLVSGKGFMPTAAPNMAVYAGGADQKNDD